MTIETNVLNRVEQEPDLTSIFNGDSDWYFPSPELCKREGLFPNMLAYSKVSATLALIAKRSKSDYALSEPGLHYLETMLSKGTPNDGAPVRSVFVVLADVDLRRPPRYLKLISYSSVREVRARCNELQPCTGKFGPYWWLTADTLSAEDEAF